MERRNRICQILFAVYCIAMLYLLFGREEAPKGLPYSTQLLMRLNLQPFHTISRQLKLLVDTNRPWLIRHALINLSGNIVLFVPLGIFLGAFLQRFWKVLLVTAGIITLVEILQILTLLGRCDIDDLILNLTGSAIGYGLYKWIFKESLPH